MINQSLWTHKQKKRLKDLVSECKQRFSLEVVERLIFCIWSTTSNKKQNRVADDILTISPNLGEIQK
jgi:3-oxoacyl-ACP reductase-like protein